MSNNEERSEGADYDDTMLAGLAARARRLSARLQLDREELASVAATAQPIELVFPGDEDDPLLPLPPGLSPAQQRTMYISLQRQRDELIYGIDTEDGVFVPPPPLPLRPSARLADAQAFLPPTAFSNVVPPRTNPDVATPFFAFRDTMHDRTPTPSSPPVQHLYCGGQVESPPGWRSVPSSSHNAVASSSRTPLSSSTTTAPLASSTSATFISPGCGRLISSRAIIDETSRNFPANIYSDHEHQSTHPDPLSYSTDFPPSSSVAGDLFNFRTDSTGLGRYDSAGVGDFAQLKEEEEKAGWSFTPYPFLRKGCRGCSIKHLGCKECGNYLGYRVVSPCEASTCTNTDLFHFRAGSTRILSRYHDILPSTYYPSATSSNEGEPLMLGRESMDEDIARGLAEMPSDWLRVHDPLVTTTSPRHKAVRDANRWFQFLSLEPESKWYKEYLRLTSADPLPSVQARTMPPRQNFPDLPVPAAAFPRLTRSGAIRSTTAPARQSGALSRLTGSALTTTQPSTASTSTQPSTALSRALEAANALDGVDETPDLESRAWRESGERLLREIFSPPPAQAGAAGARDTGARRGAPLPSMLLASGNGSGNDSVASFTRMGGRMIVMSSSVEGEAGIRSAFIRIIARARGEEAPTTPPTASQGLGEGGLTPPTNSLRSAYASPGWPYRASSSSRPREADPTVNAPAAVPEHVEGGVDDEGGRRNRRRLNGEDHSIGR